jgi:flagellar basal-body rod modification protein FlgD
MPDLIPLSAVLEARNPQASSSNDIKPTNELDKDAFLQLLVAQLRYQNPLSPSDPNQFMAQTAQFTMVEKLTELATHEARQRLTSETMVATSTLGREVSWLDEAGEEQTGVVTGTSFRATGPVLLVGEDEVTLDQLLGVRAAPTPATPATESTNSTADTPAAAPTTPTTTNPEDPNTSSDQEA